MVHGRTRRVRQKKRAKQTGQDVTEDKITINADTALNVAVTALISGVVSGVVAKSIGGNNEP